MIVLKRFVKDIRFWIIFFFILDFKVKPKVLDLLNLEKDLNTYHQLNVFFHERLMEMSGNKKLLSLYKKLIRELSLFRRANIGQADVLPLSASEHQNIVKAIEKKDPNAAAKALFDHVQESKERTIQRHQTIAVNS